MASQKVTVTQQYQKNSPASTAVTLQNVDTEIVNNQVVARQEIIRPGVVSASSE